MDAVIYNVPLVASGYLQHTVVCRSVDVLPGVLYQHDGVLGHLDLSEGRGAGAVGHVVVGRTRIIHAPVEIILAVAVEDVGSLAEGIVLQGAALGGHHRGGAGLEAHHVVIEFGSGHVAVAPVEVVLAAHGVGEDIHVNLLSATHSFGQVIDDGVTQVLEGSRRRVGHGHSDGLAVALRVMAAEIEIVLVRAVLLLHLLDAGCPCVAAGPCHIGVEVEHDTLVCPVDEVGTGEHGEIVATPSGCAIGGGVDVELTRLVGEHHLRVGMELGQDGVAACLLCLVFGCQGQRKQHKGCQEHFFHIVWLFHHYLNGLAVAHPDEVDATLQTLGADSVHVIVGYGYGFPE